MEGNEKRTEKISGQLYKKDLDLFIDVVIAESCCDKNSENSEKALIPTL